MNNTKLIERLRKEARQASAFGNDVRESASEQAADAIETLQAENAALLKANLDCVDRLNEIKLDYAALRAEVEAHKLGSSANFVSMQQEAVRAANAKNERDQLLEQFAASRRDALDEAAKLMWKKAGELGIFNHHATKELIGCVTKLKDAI
jgi:hypothetical protein